MIGMKKPILSILSIEMKNYSSSLLNDINGINMIHHHD
jgi:hypothetical protein